MYRAIETFKMNNPKASEIHNHLYSHFHGFDGNNETAHLGFVKFLIERQNKYAEQKAYIARTDGFNSHAPMIGHYKKMLTAWYRFQNRFNLTADQIMEILNTK